MCSRHQPEQGADSTKAETVWIRYETQERWHITGLWSKETLCGKAVSGDEESQVYLPSLAPVCSACWKAR